MPERKKFLEEMLIVLEAAQMLLDQKRRTINAIKYRTDFSTVFRRVRRNKYLILKVIGIHPIGLGSDLKKILQFGVVNSEVNILVLHSPYRKG